MQAGPANTTVYFEEPTYLLLEGLVPAVLFFAAGSIAALYFVHMLKAGSLRFPLILGGVTLAVNGAVYIGLFLTRNMQPFFVVAAVCFVLSDAVYGAYLAKTLKKEKAHKQVV